MNLKHDDGDIAIIQYGGDIKGAQVYSEKKMRSHVYWYPVEEWSETALAQEIEDLKEFYEFIVVIR